MVIQQAVDFGRRPSAVPVVERIAEVSAFRPTRAGTDLSRVGEDQRRAVWKREWKRLPSFTSCGCRSCCANRWPFPTSLKSAFSMAEESCRRVKRWRGRGPSRTLGWVGSPIGANKFRRLKGYKEIWQLGSVLAISSGVCNRVWFCSCLDRERRSITGQIESASQVAQPGTGRRAG